MFCKVFNNRLVQHFDKGRVLHEGQADFRLKLTIYVHRCKVKCRPVRRGVRGGSDEPPFLAGYIYVLSM